MAVSVDFSANPSLNEIVSSLAARVDKPDDVGLMDELKHIVSYKRSKAIHEWLRRDPAMRIHFYQSFNADLEKALASECIDFPTSCYILRTKCVVPEPLRDGFVRHEWQMYDYVGSVSGYNPYSWMYPEHLQYAQARKFTKNRPKWFYQNSRIYIVNMIDGTVIPAVGEPPPPDGVSVDTSKSIKIRGVFENALTLDECNICSINNVTTCVSDDDPYAIPRELLNDIVKDILATELRAGPIPSDEKQESDDAEVDSVEKTEHQNS